MVHPSFGANATKIFKLFKLLFVLQDPMVNVTSRTQAPNHKFDHFLSHIIQVSAKAFELGSNIYSEKKDAAFQGNHEGKQWVTFKCAWNGLLIDEFCEDGYNINFYVRNFPPPKNCSEKGKSPTNS